MHSAPPIRDASTNPPEKRLTVAICIGTYNQSQYLKAAIESALAQSCPIDEIWISDDCSPDDTAEVVRQYSERFPQIHYYRHPANIGPARNLSWALSQASTDLVVRLDSDDRLEPEYVETLAGLMAKYPKAGYAHCNVWETDINSQRARLRQLARTAEYETPEEALVSNGMVFRTAANCILFRAEALRQGNYYLEHPSWTASEDWDLALRIAINGWGNAYSPKVLSNYRQWDDPKGVRAYRKIQEVSSNAYIFKEVLIPEYTRRGWSIAPLKRYMRSKAVGFADSIDSPQFSEQDRVEYRRHLKELGDSMQLSFALAIADMGLNPLVRRWKRLKRNLKDTVKRVVRPVRTAPV